MMLNTIRRQVSQYLCHALDISRTRRILTKVLQGEASLCCDYLASGTLMNMSCFRLSLYCAFYLLGTARLLPRTQRCRGLGLYTCCRLPPDHEPALRCHSLTCQGRKSDPTTLMERVFTLRRLVEGSVFLQIITVEGNQLICLSRVSPCPAPFVLHR